jgi:hypothetical protein
MMGESADVRLARVEERLDDHDAAIGGIDDKVEFLVEFVTTLQATWATLRTAGAAGAKAVAVLVGLVTIAFAAASVIAGASGGVF